MLTLLIARSVHCSSRYIASVSEVVTKILSACTSSSCWKHNKQNIVKLVKWDRWKYQLVIAATSNCNQQQQRPVTTCEWNIKFLSLTSEKYSLRSLAIKEILPIWRKIYSMLSVTKCLRETSAMVRNERETWPCNTSAARSVGGVWHCRPWRDVEPTVRVVRLNWCLISVVYSISSGANTAYPVSRP